MATVVLAVTIGVLFATGTFLLLQRTLTRVVLGVGLLGHGVNLLLVFAGGRAGPPPFDSPDGLPADFADPLAQAMVLTAIVIGFGITGFLLALALRSYRLVGHDEVEDDLEDRRIARRGLRLDPAENRWVDASLPSDTSASSEFDEAEGAGSRTPPVPDVPAEAPPEVPLRPSRPRGAGGDYSRPARRPTSGPGAGPGEPPAGPGAASPEEGPA